MKKYLVLIVILFVSFASAQDSTGSLAFKKNRPVKRSTLFYQPDLSYRIWQQFNLIKEANSGNSLAQHELGLRYLLGDDQPADTAKAAFWIRKAALQKLPAAAFNYGILLFNGWGIEWNPFEAYKNFLIAANDGMPQAEYIVGLLHTDNFILKKDWGKAYYYIKKAADKSHKPAVEILPQIKKYLPADFDTTGKIVSYSVSGKDNSPGLVFIDFDRPVTDPSEEVSDSLLFEDLLLPGNKKFEQIVTVDSNGIKINFDRNDLDILNEAAGWGCPEALTLLGSLYEKGIHYPQDEIKAASNYIRAAKFDSYRSTLLLYNLVKDDKFVSKLKEAALKNEPEAMFAWYGIYDFSLDNSITEGDALNLLIKSAEKKYTPALVEFGLIKYVGKYVKKNTSDAINIWNNVSDNSNNEAKVRIAASVIYGEIAGDMNSAVETILKANENGSVLAQVVLGYLYEKKYLFSGNSGEDIKYYRNAAQRGNRFAVQQLQRRYDEVRPPDPEFQVDD